MLYLASNSPRRRELLKLGGWAFQLLPVEVDEHPEPGEQPAAYVHRLAEAKARVASRLVAEPGVVVAADTTVACCGPQGEDILGKPADANQAEAMLRRLRGRTHWVYTALALLPAGETEPLMDCCRSDVPMREYSDAEMRAYIASGDPWDKAGAYAIQHAGFHPVEELQGCYANVMGLPLCHLARNLGRLGMHPLADVARACQKELAYACKVYPLIQQWAL